MKRVFEIDVLVCPRCEGKRKLIAFLTDGPVVRSDNGPEFTATAVREWLARVGVKTLFIEPGSPWENGYIESFNRKLRDELLNGEIFYTLREAQVVIEHWRREYNHIRPHSSIGYRPPAPLAVLPASATYAPLRLPMLALEATETLR